MSTHTRWCETEPDNHGGNCSSDEDFRSRTQGSGFDEAGAGAVFVEGERAYNTTYWPYRLPADHQESLRQDHQHHLLAQELPGLYRGPVEEVLSMPGRVKRILDIGCGTGIWLAEMAEMFPHVDCVGIDIMPNQHDHQRRNCTFMFIEAPAAMQRLPDLSFDVIHIRQMLFSVAEYEAIVAEAFRLLRPGGLILIHECTMVMESGWPGKASEDIVPATTQWAVALVSALSTRGINVDLFDSMPDILAGAGFDGDDIDSYHYSRQFCAETYLGQIDHTLAFIDATRLLMLESEHMSAEDFDVMLDQIANEIKHYPNEGVAYIYARWGYWWVMKAVS